MKNYTVITAVGEYHVRASNEEGARDAIYKLTFGRVDRTDMIVRRRG